MFKINTSHSLNEITISKLLGIIILNIEDCTMGGCDHTKRSTRIAERGDTPFRV
jgi:hypothetical protein